MLLFWRLGCTRDRARDVLLSKHVSWLLVRNWRETIIGGSRKWREPLGSRHSNLDSLLLVINLAMQLLGWLGLRLMRAADAGAIAMTGTAGAAGATASAC